MDLEKLLNYLTELPNNINVTYSNINGKESLKVNGEEILDKFDDSELLSDIAHCKKILDSLDDCTFEEVVNNLKEDENIKELNEIFEKEHFTEEESEEVERKLDKIKNSVVDVVNDRITELENILEEL